MKTISSVPGKGTIAAIAAGAMALASAAPAHAEHRDRDGISAGEIIAGALIIGGIAAVASAASNNNDRYDRDYRYDRAGYGYNQGYGYRNDYAWRGNPRQAVEQCVYAAERNAGRYSYGRADVTDVRDIRQTRFGYEVRGRIAVNGNGRDWRRGDGNYGRGWGGDYRGWNDNLRGYDSGTFKCTVERGRIVDIDYSGLRGL